VPERIDTGDSVQQRRICSRRNLQLHRRGDIADPKGFNRPYKPDNHRRQPGATIFNLTSTSAQAAIFRWTQLAQFLRIEKITFQLDSKLGQSCLNFYQLRDAVIDDCLFFGKSDSGNNQSVGIQFLGQGDCTGDAVELTSPLVVYEL